MDSIAEILQVERYKEYNSDVAIDVARGMATISGLLAASSFILSFRNGNPSLPSVLFGKHERNVI
jgi:hypothetical protein